MAKTCPSCGYGPIGPFIDNCPLCAEPVRNVRSGGGGSGRSGGMPPWLRWVLVGSAAAVLAVAGCCAYGAWQLNVAVQDAQKAMQQAQADAEAERRARTVAVSAADLLREFQADPAAADRRYKGKYLEVSGVVDRTGTDGNDTPFVILHGGDAAAAVKIECFFDTADEWAEGRVGRLAAGEAVTVRGEYDGRVSHVQVRECELSKSPQHK